LAENFDDLLKIIKEQIVYYNYQRYHSAIGFITPDAKYSGKGDNIFSEKEKKLKKQKNEE